MSTKSTLFELIKELEKAKLDSIRNPLNKRCGDYRIGINKAIDYAYNKIQELDDSMQFTKQDLKNAWMHGDLRVPKKHQFLNNFDDYFKFEHGNNK